MNFSDNVFIYYGLLSRAQALTITHSLDTNRMLRFIAIMSLKALRQLILRRYMHASTFWLEISTLMNAQGNEIVSSLFFGFVQAFQ